MEYFYLQLLFWLSLFLLFYSYIGYGMVLYGLVILKRKIFPHKPLSSHTLPEVTLIVPAYNERSCIEQKIQNSLALNYPAGKLTFLFVTEGSTDGTTEYLAQYPQVTVLGGSERKGKIEAINLAMQQINTPIVVFTDANTLLNQDALLHLVKHYSDPKVGAVAGEKRILNADKEEAAGAGEGIYWQYESLLKKLDSELYSVVGAAGELFSMRTHLYQPVEKDTLLDDFIISLRIAAQGYQVVYEPDAYAMEKPSFSIQEEMKRKVRICTGGFQSIVRLKHLLNPFRYGLLSFQYISHRVFRWTVAPLCIPVIFITNALLMPLSRWYEALFILQCVFYLLALTGYLLERRKFHVKALFVPFYFSFMNYTVYLGFIHYLGSKQTGIWEKARRS
ncbi:glycosyltransferase family 2 protein [Rhodocytophaga rosea]|uniref:Glycosyltransferase family 2 protein n=1 Tax=Rhodocytophaga rosea TaxID=2704465 RepID=A0A6C0GQI1_9BACT|nr:glycosyltransferase family 2 protein [Rhodocytophaga rosea]QHT70338.1 glycosyltransferase family 2 protein [Rhodocytophaga rosea]